MHDEILAFAGPHFTRAELQCHCGCGALPQTVLMMKLKQLRDILKTPLTITSAMRCPRHNNAVSDTGETGPHTTGLAVDIECWGELTGELLTHALELDVAGIGVSQRGPRHKRFVHLDWTDRPYLTVWSY